MKVYFDIQGALTVKGEDNTEHLALGVWAERFLGGNAPLVIKRQVPRNDDPHPWEDWESQKLYASKEGEPT